MQLNYVVQDNEKIDITLEGGLNNVLDENKIFSQEVVFHKQICKNQVIDSFVQ